MKRFFALVLALLCLLPLASCGSVDYSNATKLSFKSASSYEYLKELDGKAVTINGYMATSSPVDGSFIFLMNLPYQSCPFCKPNTSQLSNTIEVYPKKNQSFDYSNQAIKVTGIMEVAKSGKPFTDQYGYEFNFKIVDAEYVILKDSDLSAETALWQTIANSGIITDIYSMFDYLNFITNWGTYTATFQNGEDYLYPADLDYFCFNDKTQYHYGTVDGYFDGIIADIRKISTELEDLVAIIERCKTLSANAISEIKKGNYSQVAEYTTKSDDTLYFNDGRKQYKMTNQALITENDTLYNDFYQWFSAWEL